MKRGKSNRLCTGLPRAAWQGVVLAVALTWPACAPACFYSSYTFNTRDAVQTKPYDLLYDHYEVHSVTHYAKELTRLQREYDKRKDDLDYLDDLAFLYQQTIRFNDAEKLWKSILLREPDRFQTLCNYATGLQAMRRYDEAHALLSRAARMRPDLRGGAEEWHLRMIDFQRRVQADPSHGASHLFIDELTPIWESHTEPSKSFRKVKLPVAPLAGVTELLRQFPSFGDGWLVHAMLLEHDGEYSLAKLSYNRALKTGASQNDRIKRYMAQYQQFEQKAGRAGEAGQGVLRIIIIVAAFFAARYGLGLYRAIRAERYLRRHGGVPGDRPKTRKGGRT